MKPSPRELLDAAARTYVPDNLNLYPRLYTQLKRKTFMQTLHAKPALLILTILLALTLITGVAYAIGKLAGFIPGFGFTGDASTVYILQEPVQIEQDGITILVENAVSAEDKFWISLSRNGNYEAGQPLMPAVLVILPDGTQIRYQAGQEDDQNPDLYKESYEFPALPIGTDELSLRYEFLTNDGTTLWSAEIPVKLRLIRTDEMIPVQETQAPLLQSKTYDGLTLVLDNVAPASDKTILQVSLRFDQPNTNLNTNWNVVLKDSDGKIYPLTEVMSDTSNRSKTYETLPFRGGESLTMSLTAFPDANNLPMSVDFSMDQSTFMFDPGTDPQVGQNWTLDQKMQVGKYNFHVVGAKQVSATELLFEFAPLEEVTSVMLYSPLANSATGNIPMENANFTASLFFEKIPTQPIPVSITRIGYIAHGQWQIQWQAPAAPQNVVVGPTNTPAPTASVYEPTAITSSDPLVLEIQTLAQKFDAPFQKGAGWIHIVTDSEAYQRPGQNYPHPYITSEKWLELDVNGNVIRTLWTDRDKDGNVIQQSVTIGKYFMNFTTGESGYNEYSSYPFSTDLLTHDLVQAEQYQSQVTREKVTCDDGAPCLLITLFDEFDQPSQNPDETQPITGMGRRTWVNILTGQQVRVQAFTRFQDGSERMEFTDDTLLVEKLEKPSEEILTILNGVVVP